jgi:hypothetical protein
MAITTADPTRFQPYHEPLRATMVRTGLIALASGTIVLIMRLGRLPGSLAEAYAWMVLVLSVLWISFGGHWLEVAYLNALRPGLARLPDWLLIFVRIGVWVSGGTLLMFGAATTYIVMTTGHMPSESALRSILCYGGLVFAAIELVPHTILMLLGRPSFWNLRG